MVKKISFLILSAGILVIGVTAFNKLNYWDRSIRIFTFSSDTSFEGRTGSRPGSLDLEGREGHGEREGFNRHGRTGEGFTRPEMHNLPDSIRARFEKTEGQPGFGIKNGEGRGRGEFPGGKKINIHNVKWFLAVFASFTVIAIYIDKAICLIRKRKEMQNVVKENI